MSHANPTPLRVGAKGTLHGWSVRVVGRVVLGMQDEDGETYYWHEYNLVDAAGTCGTLVYEDTEDGPEWKLFTALEPANPLSARDAAQKRVGHTVNLDGRPTKITLVDQSRVYHIEGTAPEGVQVGDVAHYFNADAGERMLVASWTGDDIEFYEGRDLRADEVAAAFGFPSQTTATSSFRSGSTASAAGSSSGLVTKVIVALITLAAAFGIYSCVKRPQAGRASGPPPVQPAPTVRLANGARGTLQQRDLTVATQAVVAVGRVGARHERREYELRDGAERALLVHALNGSAREWHLFQPISAPSPALAAVPPYEAAAQRKGAPVSIDRRTLRVTDLFLTRPVRVEGDNAAATWPGVQYGFIAREADEWLMARWTESQIQFFRGRLLAERDVLTAFGPPQAAR